MLTVSGSAINVTKPITSSASVTSSADITTSGTVYGSAVVGTASVTGNVLVASTSLTTPSLLSSSNTVTLGADAAFTIKKPTHSSGNGTDLVFKGQQASSSSNGIGGDVVLQPGSKDGSGSDGKIKFSNGDGTTVMQVAGSTVEVMAGNTLTISGSLSVKGTRVATPPNAITIGNDATKVTVQSEFLVLNCDDGDANMREEFNPIFEPGTNGQVVHVINVGTD